MYFEIVIVAVLIFIILTSNGFINPNKFIQDNQDIFMKLKEDDYDFLVRPKYGDGLDPDVLFQKRIKNGLIVIILLIFVISMLIGGNTNSTAGGMKQSRIGLFFISIYWTIRDFLSRPNTIILQSIG